MRTISDVQRGGELKTLRESARLTQRQVAEHFKIDKASISAWERGKGRPTPDKLGPLDRLYGSGGAVLELFAAVSRTRGGSTDAKLQSQVTRLAKIVEKLSDDMEELRSVIGTPGRPARR